MGSRGPKATPGGVGNLTFAKGIPPAPDWLSDEARAEYDRVAQLLADADVVQLVDLAYLTTYAASFAKWNELEQSIARVGTAVEGSQGGVIQNPDVRTQTTVFSQMDKAAGKLGLSPSDRERLTQPAKPKKEDGADRFLKGKKR